GLFVLVSGRSEGFDEERGSWSRDVRPLDSVRTESRLGRGGWGRRARPSRGGLPDDGGGVRAGGKLGQGYLGLALGTTASPPQYFVPVLGGQMRSELGDAAEVQASVGEHGQEHGMGERSSAGRDAQISFGLREVQDLGAIGIHGGACLAGVEPALVDLSDLRNKVDFRAAGLRQGLGGRPEQAVGGGGLGGAVGLAAKQ